MQALCLPIGPGQIGGFISDFEAVLKNGSRHSICTFIILTQPLCAGKNILFLLYNNPQKTVSTGNIIE
jgi:hypothetical protein